jgi:hypothetical protein
MGADQIDEFIQHRCGRTDMRTKFGWQRKERALVEDTAIDGWEMYIFLVTRNMA